MSIHSIGVAARRAGLRALALAALALAALALTVATPLQAQQQPSAGSIAAAKEIITIKGAAKMFEPIVPGIVEQAKMTFLQNNPMLNKDLGEISVSLRTEYSARFNDVFDEVARLYATHFTEQELKDALAFYKSPLGRKLVDEEPKILDQSMAYGQTWANKLSEEVFTRMRAELKKKGHDM